MRIVIFCAITAISACSKAAPPAPQPGPVPGSDGVTLVAPGDPAEPRLLRYQVERGAKSRIDLAMDMELDAGGRGGIMPTLAMSIEIAIEDVLGDGSAKIRTTILSARARERAGSSIPVQMMGQMAQDLAGLSFTATLAPSGKLRDGKLDSRQLPKSLEQQLAKLTQILEQVAMPLPDVPVGVGAKWTTRKTVAQEGLEMVTLTTIELVKRDGNQLGFTSVSTITAPDQELDNNGVHVAVRDLGGGGSASGTIDLARATLVGTSQLEFRGTMSAQGQTAPMKMAMAVSMAPTP